MKSLTNLSILLLGTLIIATACEDGCGGRQPSPLHTGSTFAFAIYDEEGENIFPERYDPFAFEIIDDNGDTLDIDSFRHGQDGFYSFVVAPAYGESFMFGQQKRRTFYLQFDSIDTDTLELFFVPRDACEDYMDDFEAYYNNELIFKGEGKDTYSAQIIKR